MRLKSIKLAGFKSFALPTEIRISSNMTGVVGPNGCGKSNILDAVRWVLGESQAKYLRGDSMADVVFNGSSTRKPVSCASIELVFDNTDGKLTGAYASYDEISLKRMVCRDGQSNYYLNNTKCRKKDITDLFLGTGLSARSYAIIEQGMISRIIESKPDELRQYLEEAANVSYYKDRKKDTLSRLRRAEENLLRLQDMKAELNRSLEKLREQAATAQKYQKLKAEERDLQALHTGLKWQDYQNKIKQLSATLLDLDSALIKEETLQANSTLSFNEFDEIIANAEFAIEEEQNNYFSLKSQLDISREKIAHKSKRHAELLSDLDDVKTQQSDLAELSDQQQEKIRNLEAESNTLAENLETAKLEVERLNASMAEKEAQMQEQSGTWRQQHMDSSAMETQILRAKDKLEQKTAEKLKLETKLEKLNTSLMQLSASGDFQQLDIWQEELEELEEQRAELNLSQEDNQDEIAQLREDIAEKEDFLNTNRENLASIKNKIAGLEAVLFENEQEENAEFADWLDAKGWNELEKLADIIEVDEPWQKALERVLQDKLKSYLLDIDATSIAESINPPVAKFAAIEQSEVARGNFAENCLANFVLAPQAVLQILKNVLVAENLTQAIAMQKDLQAGQSLITKQGFWLGKDWFVASGELAGTGILGKKQDLIDYQDQLLELEENINGEQSLLQELKNQLNQKQNFNDEMGNAQQALLQKIGNLNSSIAGIEAQKSASVKAMAEQSAEQEELSENLAELEEEIAELGLQIEDLEQNFDADANMQADQAHQEFLQEVQNIRKELFTANGIFKDLEATSKNNAYALQSSLENVQRYQSQASQLQAKQANLENQLKELDFIDENSDLLDELESEVSKSHNQVEFLKIELKEHKDKQKALDQNIKSSEKRHKQFSEQKIQLQVNKENIQAQQREILNTLVEKGYDLESILQKITDKMTLKNIALELEQIGDEITALGDLNLAAIQELAEEEERADFYIQQEEELTAAMQSLNEAIEKLDKETQKRFTNTFNAINQKLGEIFPKIFGGGAAWLEMTDANLLETGVSIMARPAGKKNSSIHLLSGGEKALTALALIFAIFELNPAPFCLLDEVDAPLDEANVVRYANLVKQMSERIQFLFITHNKATMQRADKLLGVTMQEAGVSRIVAVDLAEAMSYINV